jgi:hypothetical protein
MTRLTFLILTILFLIFSSCQSRRARLDRRNLIPEKQLVPILTDIYLTDGLIGVPRIVMKYSPLDSSSTYNYLIEKHGYTKEAMDRTLKYYFVKNPKKLIKIYDKVLGILSEMESRQQKELAKIKVQPTSLWSGPDSYYYPDPSGTDSPDFDLTFKRQGSYTLTANVILFPDDQSLNPGLTAYTCNPDSTETGKRHYIKPFCYIKDGHQHRYIVSFSVPVKTTLRVIGSLYASDNNPDDWEKHIIIKNISVSYSLVTQ